MSSSTLVLYGKLPNHYDIIHRMKYLHLMRDCLEISTNLVEQVRELEAELAQLRNDYAILYDFNKSLTGVSKGRYPLDVLPVRDRLPGEANADYIYRLFHMLPNITTEEVAKLAGIDKREVLQWTRD